MYNLTLTLSERSAIDFVGYRYPHGDDLFKLLIQCDTTPADHCWNDPFDITYIIQASTAQDIFELLEDCQYELFAPHLKFKLLTFLESTRIPT